MAPLRRYLRITRYTVLEVRIYLEEPSDAPWLLRDRVLSRIFEEIRPKVLPKLREENENSRKRVSRKRRVIKDVVSKDDFEVVLFLAESITRHTMVTKQKQFTKKPSIKSTGTKLTGWLGNTNETAIDVEDNAMAVPGLLREESEGIPNLNDVPELKRHATTGNERALFVNSDDEDIQTEGRHNLLPEQEGDLGMDDKKKLGLNTSYDGFTLYGKVLCLIVKRTGQRKSTIPTEGPTGGSEMMESWVSTQIDQLADLDDDG